MNILLTNDDGYGAPGIVLLEEILKAYGTVYVVAPKVGKSGASSSLTIRKWVDLKKVDNHHFIIDGNPVDCVIYGLTGLNVSFDLVVSGCNNGYNISFDCIYSGTIGACFQALVHHVPTIAFSTDFDQFIGIQSMIIRTIEYILKNQLLNKHYLLNVNLPKDTLHVEQGILLTRQFIRTIHYECLQQEGKVYLGRLQIEEPTDDLYDDVYAIKNGYISITPLQMTRFNEELYQSLLTKVKK